MGVHAIWLAAAEGLEKLWTYARGADLPVVHRRPGRLPSLHMDADILPSLPPKAVHVPLVQ